MKRILERLWREDEGTLSFEWVTLTTLLTIGAVGGLASVRDAVVDEMADMTEAIVSLDQSYVVEPPCLVSVHSSNGSTARVREFRLTGPGVGVQVRPPRLQGSGSGAAGTLFRDTRPEVDRQPLGTPTNPPAADPLQGEL
ncbi:MAG: hypothetical protein J5I93_16780 [Pirellulaceae bacterium]|nr:hypothetical protein [Pirellulaceae bacterium]